MDCDQQPESFLKFTPLVREPLRPLCVVTVSVTSFSVWPLSKVPHVNVAPETLAPEAATTTMFHW